MLQIFLALVLVLMTAGLSAFSHLDHRYRQASLQSCQLIDENYYRRDQPEAQNFVNWCRQKAETQTFLFSRSANIRRLNARLSAMKVSHLAVNNPEENRLLWENQGLDSGIRSRMIDGEMVIHRLLPGSPAEKVGLRVGDSLLTLNGEDISSAQQAQTARGLIYARRRQSGTISYVDLQFTIEPEQITENMAPEFVDLGRGRGLLRIPSFLAQYFDADEWRSVVAKTQGVRSLVVDLRENGGGSFPAMLRALSPFFCEAKNIGQIYHSVLNTEKNETDLLDDLDAQNQLQQLASARAVVLKTFADYGCFRGAVTVLIDSGTSSVSEIFAQAMLLRPHTRVWGQPSAGQVVMARWFPLSDLGGDEFVMSVPIAGYKTIDGIELEERGVRPGQYLFYDLPKAFRGIDSWIEQANVPF